VRPRAGEEARELRTARRARRGLPGKAEETPAPEQRVAGLRMEAEPCGLQVWVKVRERQATEEHQVRAQPGAVLHEDAQEQLPRAELQVEGV